MVYGGRPSTGCHLCRKRKIKCDEALPECRNCLIYGRPCPGYRQDTIFRNETRKVERLMRRTSDFLSSGRRNSQGALDSSDRQGSPLSLYQIADSTWEERSICYFFDQYTTIDQSDVCVHHLSFLPSLYATCRDNGKDGTVSSSLRLAVDATALVSLGNEMKAQSLVVKARDRYGMALRGLRQALASQSQAVKDETFATMILLSLFEDITGERNGLTSSHTAGFELLMKLRGADQLCHAQGRDLFSFAYAHTNIEILALKEKPRFPMDWIVGQLDSSDPVHNLMTISTKISHLFLEASSLGESLGDASVATLTSWIQTAHLMDVEVAGWSQHMPDTWLPLIVSSRTGETLMTYQRVSVGIIWKYHRAVRIILQKHILDLYRELASVVGDTGMSIEALRGETEALDVIQEMITDVCRSIPFSIGDIDMLGNPLPPSADGKPRIRAFYGYIMLWPLWYILSCGLASPAQTEQIRGVLARVGSALGIKLALMLAEDSGSQCAIPSNPSQPQFMSFLGNVPFTM